MKMKKTDKLSRKFLEFLVLLESETASGGSVLEFSDFEMLLFHLKKISILFLKSYEENDGEELTVPENQVISQILIKLTDLGQIPLDIFNEIPRKEVQSDVRCST